MNNKGITLTEIIISIALISIVLVLLFSLLVTVNDTNEESKINSTYLINKSLILKSIEEDLTKDTDGITLRTCEASDIYSSYTTTNLDLEYQASECIMIDYDNDINTENAKLGIYYYLNKKSYVISYINNEKKSTRLLNEFEKFNVENGMLNNKMKITLNNESNSCNYDTLYSCSNIDKGFMSINIPIIGSDGKDYSIIISYYGKVSIE